MSGACRRPRAIHHYPCHAYFDVGCYGGGGAAVASHALLHVCTSNGNAKKNAVPGPPLLVYRIDVVYNITCDI